MILTVLGAAALLLGATSTPAAAQANSLEAALAPGYDPVMMEGLVNGWGLPKIKDEASPDGERRAQVFGKGAVLILMFYGGCTDGTDCAGIAMMNPLPTAQMGVRLTLADINEFNSNSGYAFLSDEGDGFTATNWGSPALKGCDRICQADQFSRFTGVMGLVVEELVGRRGQSLVMNDAPSVPGVPAPLPNAAALTLPGLTPLAEAEATTGLLRRADALMDGADLGGAESLAEEFFPALVPAE